MFHFLDINNDSVLDLADVTLMQDNYVRLHNLSAEEVCSDRETKLSKSIFILISLNFVFII